MNPETIRDKFHACGFLYNPRKAQVLLHKRDGNTQRNPHKWAFFGGLNEEGETYVECFLRELKEEIGLSLEKTDARLLREYANWESAPYRVVFYAESEVSEDQLVLGEGAGFAWVPLASVIDLDLTDATSDDLGFFRSLVGQSS
jgi:8-oxo-dGTP pyrophosphatase MutT (NUDIX family)